jgi:hypothetical protein
MFLFSIDGHFPKLNVVIDVLVLYLERPAKHRAFARSQRGASDTAT